MDTLADTQILHKYFELGGLAVDYKELIIGLLERIDSEKFPGRTGSENLPGLVDSEKFLKRIYISLREYVRESEGKA